MKQKGNQVKNRKHEGNAPLPSLNVYTYWFCSIYSWMKFFTPSYRIYRALHKTDLFMNVWVIFFITAIYERTISYLSLPRDPSVLMAFIVPSFLLIWGVNYLIFSRHDKYLKLYEVYSEKRTLGKDLLCAVINVSILVFFAYAAWHA